MNTKEVLNKVEWDKYYAIKREHPDTWIWLWQSVSKDDKLSEDCIREFRFEVDWRNICKYQVLSENFIKEMLDYIDMESALKYQKLSNEFRNFLKNKYEEQNKLLGHLMKQYRLNMV